MTIDPLPLAPEPPPLRVDTGGVVRVGTSRVSLDVVVEQYENGMSVDELLRAYDTLTPADVYAAIAYYLRHRDAVTAYLTRRRQEADALRATVEGDHPRFGRDELLARQVVRGAERAAAGQ